MEFIAFICNSVLTLGVQNNEAIFDIGDPWPQKTEYGVKSCFQISHPI